VGIRLDGKDNIRNTVLYGNSCEQVARLLEDRGRDTKRVCPANSESGCDCAARE
jgi:hypothetical protein